MLSPEHQQINDFIDEQRDTLLHVSHEIHAHPELGYQEYYAAELLTKTLKDFGFEVTTEFVDIPTAFIARKAGKGSKPRIAFLAEYDALPDVGHACGHNIISTTSVTAGIGLASVLSDYAGEVCVIGTPAEETDGAKVVMVRKGVFADFDAALMIHPYTDNYYLTEALALDPLQVNFHGKPAHAAASPWLGINALDATILHYNSLNALRQQLRPDVRIHGVITKGGAAANIIPDETSANFYIRAADRTYLNEVVFKFKECAYAAARATGTTVDMFAYENSFDDMFNNEPMALRFRDHMLALGSGPFKRAPDTFGSIDMGDVSQVLPAIHALVKVTDDSSLSLHTREFQQAACSPMADEAILRAGKALAFTGFDLISNPDFLAQAKTAFASRSG